MTKKILAVIIIAALGLCMLTACGKKDDTQNDTQTQQTLQQEQEEQVAKQEQTEQQEQQVQNDNTTDNQDANVDNETMGTVKMTQKEFVELVDTFNNPKSAEEKEQARLKLEATLKQAEQQ